MIRDSYASLAMDHPAHAHLASASFKSIVHSNRTQFVCQSNVHCLWFDMHQSCCLTFVLKCINLQHPPRVGGASVKSFSQLHYGGRWWWEIQFINFEKKCTKASLHVASEISQTLPGEEQQLSRTVVGEKKAAPSVNRGRGFLAVETQWKNEK